MQIDCKFNGFIKMIGKLMGELQVEREEKQKDIDALIKAKEKLLVKAKKLVRLISCDLLGV